MPNRRRAGDIDAAVTEAVEYGPCGHEVAGPYRDRAGNALRCGSRAGDGENRVEAEWNGRPFQRAPAERIFQVARARRLATIGRERDRRPARPRRRAARRRNRTTGASSSAMPRCRHSRITQPRSGRTPESSIGFGAGTTHISARPWLSRDAPFPSNPRRRPRPQVR